MADQQEHLKHIRTLPLFNQLDTRDLVTMLNKKVIRLMSFEPEEQIITEKSFDRKIFLTLNGSVKVVKDFVKEDLKINKELKQIRGSGILLGEVTAFTGKPRTASVIALTRTVCVMINVGLLMQTSSELLERVKSKFYPKLFELLCKRLDETNDTVVALRQKTEELGKGIKESNISILTLKKEHMEDLKKKNHRIKELESRLE